MSNFVTKEQTEQARNASLGEYFRQSGYSVKIHGAEMYVDEIPGLCVNVQNNSWYNHYESYGGHNAVDCLTKVLEKDFQTAVKELSNYSLPPVRSSAQISQIPKEKKALEIPERGENYRKLYAYLIKTRGIPKEIVDELVHARLLYQDKKGNAVFIHKNEAGEIIGAELFGTNTETRFKGIAKGTGDSAFIFKIGEPRRAYVFESGVDLMSFYALADKQKLQNAALVSMGGLKPTSLGGIKAKGIVIYSCVDNDEAGRKFNSENNFTVINDLLVKNEVKDWNELLLKLRNNSVEHFKNESHDSQNRENPYAQIKQEKSENLNLPPQEPLPENRRIHKSRR